VLRLPEAVAQAIKDEGEGLGLLVVRTGALGDIVRTVPAVRLLRRALPHARIHWLLDDGWHGVLAGHPDLDGIVPLPRKKWRQLGRSIRALPELSRSFLQFRRELRAVSATLVLDFQGNLRSGCLGRLSGARVRLGYSGPQQKEGNRWLNTLHVPARPVRWPRLERNLDLVRALGLPDAPPIDCELPLVVGGQPAASKISSELGMAGRPFAVISPGASARQSFKKPPVELLAAACRTLALHGVASLVVWGPGEEEDARRTVSAAAGQATLAPATDLHALAALLRQASLFVGGDSGPLHLACAVGCPVVGIYGPTDPVINGPWQVRSRSVYPPGRDWQGNRRIDRRLGFAGLAPAHVEAAVEQLLAQPAQPVQGDAELGAATHPRQP
jgi:ADP-heptose:LPS heptosyltransferase